MELCTKALIEASTATDTGLVMATRRDGRWDFVDPSEVSTLRKCGEEPVRGYVDLTGDMPEFVIAE
jgi:hypothetical protein